jgi:zinc transport system permease protein
VILLIDLLEPFGYVFMQRAVVVGLLVAISSSIIGSFLVLKRFSMIGHGLSHVTFAAVALSLVLNTEPIMVALPIVILSSIFILKINEKTTMHGDAAIGLVSSVSIAFGTVLASIKGGFNIDLYSYLFGSILTISGIDLWLSIVISLSIIFVALYYYNDLFALTYDEEYAKINNIKVKRLNTVLAVLTAATIVVGTRAIGTMLISSFIVFPMVIALQFRQGFKKTILIAATLSVINTLTGLILSYYLNLPSGSTIVLISAGLFVFVYFYQSLRSE